MYAVSHLHSWAFKVKSPSERRSLAGVCPKAHTQPELAALAFVRLTHGDSQLRPGRNRKEP